MSMKNGRLHCCIVALMLSASLLYGQTPFTVPISVTDGATSDVLTIGYDSGATLGIDSSEGEWELPPVSPTGVFDVRIVDLPPRTFHGQGLKTDIRPLAGGIQNDTFKIHFQSGFSGGPIQFSWPSGLKSSGSGRWRMVDVYGFGFLNIDMTTQTSVVIPPSYVSDPVLGSYIYILIQDTASYRSFSMDSVALSTDRKGKLKAEKKAPISSKWKFKFTNTTGQEVNGLVVKYNQTITNHLTYSPFLSADGEGTKLIKYTGSQFILPNEVIYIEGFGNKGKEIKGKAYWTLEKVPVGSKFLGELVDLELLLPKPNIHNVGEELFAAGAFGKDTGLVVGITRNPKSIYHLKYKDVTKTLNKKGIIHTGNPYCIDSAKGKAITKPLKSLSPTARNNKLVAEQLVLKFNIKISEYGMAPHGFGELLYEDVSSPLNGMSVRQIAAEADAVLSCDTSLHGGISEFTYSDWCDVISTLNNSFSGPFAVETWDPSIILTPVRPVSDIGFLKRNPNAPVVIHTLPPRATATVPENFSLQQNYPNPFNPTTTIEFTLPEDARVTISVFNIIGQPVALLADREEFTEGSNEVEFDASNLPTGVYFYRITVNDRIDDTPYFSSIRKMVLMK